MSLKRILITGSNGFFGRHLTSYLIENCPETEMIIGLDLHEETHQSSAEFIACDITDFDSLKRIIFDFQPNTIFQLAGTFNQNDLAALYKINVIGTDNLVRSSFLLSKKVRIILASSAAVYGDVPSEDNPITEEIKVNPVTHYGISKAAMEMVGNIYGQGQKDVEVIVARMFNLVGTGISSYLLPGRLAKKMREAMQSHDGKILKIGNIHPVRDFVDIRDAIEAYLLLAIKGKKNNVYNIGSGIGTKIEELVELFINNANSGI